MLSAQTVAAQTLEEGVAHLEEQVAELWRVHEARPNEETTVPAELVGNEHLRWGYPGGDCTVLVNDHLITCHDKAKRVAEWVTYHLIAENLAGDAERSDDFRPDPELPEGERAELSDYVNSGYDRGHLAPAAAFKRSDEAMSRTFVLSNMAPQTPSLNRQMWRLLEEDVRELASATGCIWVFAGSLFLDENGSLIQPTTFIGGNRVAVPTHLYEVILAEAAASAAYAALGPGAVEMFGFVIANQTEPLEGAPADYLVSVDSVEVISGLDFFSALADSVEDSLEAETAVTWPVGNAQTKSQQAHCLPAFQTQRH
jgi:endonuclease G